MSLYLFYSVLCVEIILCHFFSGEGKWLRYNHDNLMLWTKPLKYLVRA